MRLTVCSITQSVEYFDEVHERLYPESITYQKVLDRIHLRDVFLIEFPDVCQSVFAFWKILNKVIIFLADLCTRQSLLRFRGTRAVSSVESEHRVVEINSTF